MKFKLNKGAILIEPIAKTREVDGFIIEDSRSLPANKARVLQVGDADEFGSPIWEEGDTVVIPSTGVTNFDYQGRKLKIVHHRRIMIGYGEDED